MIIFITYTFFFHTHYYAMVNTNEITIQIMQLLTVLDSVKIELCYELPIREFSYQLENERSSLYDLYSKNRLLMDFSKIPIHLIETHFYLHHV